MEAVGLGLLEASAIFRAFHASGVLPQRVHAIIKPDLFVKVNTVKGSWKLVGDLVNSASTISTSGGGQPAAAQMAAEAQAGAQQQKAASAPAVDLDEVRGLVHSMAAELLGEGQILADGQFPAGGFDSLSAVELSNMLSQSLAIDLPGTLVFDYPSVNAIAGLVVSKMAPPPRSPGTVNAVSISSLPPAYQMPGNGQVSMQLSVVARLPERAWVGQDGRQLGSLDAISIVPSDRWDLEAPLVSAQEGQACDTLLMQVVYQVWCSLTHFTGGPCHTITVPLPHDLTWCRRARACPASALAASLRA